MGNFESKLRNFWDIFINQNGSAYVLTGLKNTVLLQWLGLLIGVVVAR